MTNKQRRYTEQARILDNIYTAQNEYDILDDIQDTMRELERLTKTADSLLTEDDENVIIRFSDSDSHKEMNF